MRARATYRARALRVLPGLLLLSGCLSTGLSRTPTADSSTSSGSTGGGPSGGGSGTTGASTSSGTGGGLLQPGEPCAANAACLSGVCGAAGSGHCCESACASGVSTCDATDCDTTGACAYPGSGTVCGDPPSCEGNLLVGKGVCDSHGGCTGSDSCTPFACQSGGCLTKCTSSSECATGGSFCDTAAGTCCAAPASPTVLTVDSLARQRQQSMLWARKQRLVPDHQAGHGPRRIRRRGRRDTAGRRGRRGRRLGTGRRSLSNRART